jgi:hypothetical protein
MKRFAGQLRLVSACHPAWVAGIAAFCSAAVIATATADEPGAPRIEPATTTLTVTTANLRGQAVYDTLHRPAAGAFVAASGTMIADDLETAQFYTLQSVTFALYNPANAPTPLRSVKIDVLFYSLYGGELLLTLTTERDTLNIPSGEYRLITLDRRDTMVMATDETSSPFDPDWRVLDKAAVGVRVTRSGGHPFGLVVAQPPPPRDEGAPQLNAVSGASSEDTFLVVNNDTATWTSFGGDPPANFLWRITRSGPLATDCNNDGIADGGQLGTFDRYGNYIGDVNGNGVYDGCEPDCNANGIPDDWELITGAATDLDLNGRPDVCDACPDDYRDPRESPCDCDGDGFFDSVQIRLFPERDRNDNGVIDSCEWLGDLAYTPSDEFPYVRTYNVDFFDIDPFVDALLGRLPEPDPIDVTDSYYRFNADINGDGAVDFYDVDPFVELLLAQ